MVKREIVNSFLSCRKLAVAGVSRSGKKFGNNALKELKKKGYTVYPVNPNANEIGGEKCFNSLIDLRAKVDGVVVVVPPNESLKVVKDAKSAGIKNIWLQQGAESDEAISFCSENGLNVVYGQCILMFAEPAEFFHRAHRWVRGVTGKLPA
jgi:predicted CoA-binding protein